MSKKIFSEDELIELRKNKYVLRTSEKAVTYTDEFKVLFIAESQNNKMPKMIFKEAGFDAEILGESRIRNAARRWRKAYDKEGVMGLRDTRLNNSGRPRKKDMTSEELLAKKDAEIAYLKAEVELLKKLELGERQVRNNKLAPSYIFMLIEEIFKKHKLKNMAKHLCNLASVSRSGYYRYLNRAGQRAQNENKDLLDRDIILKAFHFKGYKKGSRSIKMVLENEFGVIFNRKRIQRIMRKYGILCPQRKPNPYKRIAKATKAHRVVPNRLNRNFKQGVAGKVLLTDITYLPYREGFAYLSTIKDGSTNEILAYHLSDRITLEIATETIYKLMSNKQISLDKDAFIHSDQGVHNTSPRYQKLLKKMHLGQSMSRKGNCWDNAPMESFFGHMKDEIHYKDCDSFDELMSVVDDYMDYYNNHRCQWNLKKLTPVGYRNQLLVA